MYSIALKYGIQTSFPAAHISEQQICPSKRHLKGSGLQ